VALGTLVDSNVLLDVITEDETWIEWSSNALARAAAVADLRLLTRDATRYRTYFPTDQLTSPDTE